MFISQTACTRYAHVREHGNKGEMGEADTREKHKCVCFADTGTNVHGYAHGGCKTVCETNALSCSRVWGLLFAAAAVLKSGERGDRIKEPLGIKECAYAHSAY